MDIPTDQLVAVYLKIRDKRSTLKAQYEKEDAILKAQLETLESEMADVCKGAGASSIRTDNGTIIRSVRSRFWGSDWDAIYKFIYDYDAADLLERRISSAGVKAWVDENPGLEIPGINEDKKYVISVRRS